MSFVSVTCMTSSQSRPVYMNSIDYPDMSVSVDGWGLRLEKVLIDQGLSNVEVGDAIGLAGSTIGRYIKGQNPTLENVIALANHLKVDPGWLLFGIESTKDIWVLDIKRVEENPGQAVKAIAGLLQSLMSMFKHALELSDQAN